MLFLFGVFILFVMVGIQVQYNKAKEKRVDEAIGWIVESDRSWQGKASEALWQHHRNEMDRVIIDLQPDGYIEADDQEAAEELLDC